ncbi:MAG TPA: hypothetical protein VHT53_14475 [Candidatus Elarobacter sp.]|jgi:hypothetical protein|nr:hypothetical protein [Candidatus Elarobacter sp.]
MTARPVAAQLPAPALGTLSAVASDGAGGAIGVGATHDLPCPHPLALAGGAAAWRASRPPAPHACASLAAVATDGRGGAWAVGEQRGTDGLPHTLTERFDGRAWSVVPSPSPGRQSALAGVVVSPSGDAVAVGAYLARASGAATKTLIMENAGSGWRVVPSPSPGSSGVLNAVAADAAGALWAVGYAGDGATPRRALVLAYAPRSGWQAVATPAQATNAFDGTSLNAVAAGAGAVWAVGRYVDASNRPRVLTLRYDGRAWSLVTAPPSASNDIALEAVVVAADGTAWAAGWYADAACRHTLTMRFVGTWETVASPTPACAPTHGAALHGIAIGVQGMLYAVGESGGATLVLVNRGQGWQIVGG